MWISGNVISPFFCRELASAMSRNRPGAYDVGVRINKIPHCHLCSNMILLALIQHCVRLVSLPYARAFSIMHLLHCTDNESSGWIF